MKEPFIKRNWYLITAGIAAGIWLLRLEGRVNYVERTQVTEIAGMREDLKDMRREFTAMSAEVHKMAENIANITGYREGQTARGKR